MNIFTTTTKKLILRMSHIAPFQPDRHLQFRYKNVRE